MRFIHSYQKQSGMNESSKISFVIAKVLKAILCSVLTEKDIMFWIFLIVLNAAFAKFAQTRLQQACCWSLDLSLSQACQIPLQFTENTRKEFLSQQKKSVACVAWFRFDKLRWQRLAILITYEPILRNYIQIFKQFDTAIKTVILGGKNRTKLLWLYLRESFKLSHKFF